MTKRLPRKKFGAINQDKVLKLLLTNTKFLRQVRHFMRPEYFSFEILRKLCGAIFDFYDGYGAAPNFEQIEGIFVKMVESRAIDEDEVDVYVSYIDKLMFDVSVDLVVKNFLADNLKDFAKRRVVDALVKAIERERKKNDSLDSLYKYVVAAIEEFKSIVSESTAIEMGNVPLDVETDVVSCFNVPLIDRQLGGGIQRGMFYIVLGYTGVGKTWTLVHLGKMAARLGYLVLHVMVELSNKILKKRYAMAMSGKSIAAITRDYRYVRKVIESSMVKKSNILFVDEKEKGERVDSLDKVVGDILRKYGREPDLLLIDSAEDYSPPAGKKYRDKHDETEAVFIYCKDFAREHDMGVVSTVQAIRKGEKMKWLTSSTVAGYIAKARKATVGVSVNAQEAEKKGDHYRLMVFKNSEGDEGAKAWVRRDYERGQAVLESGHMHRDYWEQFEWEEDE